MTENFITQVSCCRTCKHYQKKTKHTGTCGKLYVYGSVIVNLKTGMVMQKYYTTLDYFVCKNYEK